MFKILVLLFLIVPVVEIYLLIELGGFIGAIPTIFLVVFTAVLGAWLLRIQGFATLRRVQGSLARGEIPAIEMLGGVLLLVSGALLLTPGFVTDTIGFLFLFPGFRRLLVLWFLSRGNILKRGFGFSGKKQDFQAGDEPSSSDSDAGRQGSHAPRTIEGEFRKED